MIAEIDPDHLRTGMFLIAKDHTHLWEDCGFVVTRIFRDKNDFSGRDERHANLYGYSFDELKDFYFFTEPVPRKYLKMFGETVFFNNSMLFRDA